MAGTTGLSDDTLELVDLLLGTTEGTELRMLLILILFGVELDGAEYVPSSWRAYGHACPGSCGATRSHASHRGRDYRNPKLVLMAFDGCMPS